LRSVTESERRKYDLMWNVDDYAIYSPGEHLVDFFFQIAKPVAGQTVLDVGAGAGAGSLALKKKGLKVRGFDLTSEAWKHEDIPLLTGSVWRDLPAGIPPFDFAYCTDVMEHIPTEFTALSVSEILRTCRMAFFSISFNQEYYGQFIGDHLHLTVRPFVWWRDVLREIGTVHEARDLLGDGIFLVGR
jgi:2-polyprenyl-3-methyl-5-hydroxy-6-metoxy-1,4-benzoquinol methylase